MSKTIEGTFRGGKVEFSQAPAVPDGARVLVTFPSDEVAPGESRMIGYGEFRSSGRQTEWTDFVEAKRAMYKDVK